MIKTHGLTHISLKVRDLDRAVQFYEQVFGVKEYYRDSSNVQVLGPGPHDVLAFEKSRTNAGKLGGVAHFGFRLLSPEDIEEAVQEVKRAGGAIIERGEFAPGVPYAYVSDPDGYTIEIWYE